MEGGGEFAAGVGGGEVLGEQTHFEVGVFGKPVQYGDCATGEMPRHEQVAHDHALPFVPNTLNAVSDDVPVVGHTANALAATGVACRGAKLEVGQIDVNGAGE